MTSKTLSNNLVRTVKDGNVTDMIYGDDVREFIKKLKDEVIGKQGLDEEDYMEIIIGINELAGDKLI